MIDHIVIRTKKGEIKGVLHPDNAYPGIELFVNNKLVAIVELANENFQVIIYNKWDDAKPPKIVDLMTRIYGNAHTEDDRQRWERRTHE